jgi:FSR family fosmidomycin resistance protein-like MFS transporter
VAIQIELPHLLSFRPADAPGGPDHVPPSRRRADHEPEPWWAFARLVMATVCRSIVYYSLLALIPLYFIEVLDSSEATGNGALTLLLVFGALGTLAGGRLADRFGRRPVFAGSMLLQVPLILILTAVGLGPAVVIAAALGFALVSSFGVTVVMGQELLPRRLGLASGFTLGVGIGFGGFCVPLFGLIADAHGLTVAVQALVPVAALGAVFALTARSPAPKPPVRLAREAQTPGI